MRVIAVDIGNSACKLAAKWELGNSTTQQSLFEPAIRWFGTSIPNDLNSRLPNEPCQWWISSVHASKENDLIQWVHQHRSNDQVQTLTHDSIPIKSSVDHRQQVGKDRLLAALGAIDHVHPIGQKIETPIVVIDVGTAVTVDFVDATGVFQGGNIFLGADAVLGLISSRANALPDLDYANRKKRLNHWRSNPHVNSNAEDLLPVGKNTVDAILSGVYHSQWGGLIHLVDRLIAACKTHDPPQVVVTGGGWFELIDAMESLSGESNSLKPHYANWIVDPALVLRGVLLAQSRP